MVASIYLWTAEQWSQRNLELITEAVWASAGDRPAMGPVWRLPNVAQFYDAVPSLGIGRGSSGCAR